MTLGKGIAVAACVGAAFGSVVLRNDRSMFYFSVLFTVVMWA
jgi:hypothetical protein